MLYTVFFKLVHDIKTLNFQNFPSIVSHTSNRHTLGGWDRETAEVWSQRFGLHSDCKRLVWAIGRNCDFSHHSQNKRKILKMDTLYLYYIWWTYSAKVQLWLIQGRLLGQDAESLFALSLVTELMAQATDHNRWLTEERWEGRELRIPSLVTQDWLYCG